MRSLFFATCLAIGVGSMAIVAPAQARVDINLPGIHIDSGHRHHHHYWGWHDRYRSYGYDHGYRRYGWR